MKKVKSVMQWGKIILPLSSIRYYPPQFTLRNPLLEGVTEAFEAGHEVVVIVFKIRNQKDLIEQTEIQQHSKLMKNMKKLFQTVIGQEVKPKEVLTLHDYFGEGISLLLKVDHDRHSISNIDIMIKNITDEVEQRFIKLHPSIYPVFEAGYMFVDKHDYSIQDSILKAHRQAIGMAEKREQLEINEMVLAINKIVTQKAITLLAQPIIDVATNEVRAWELLSRGPKGTVLESPLQLFTVARQTGRLYELEMIVVEKMLQQVKASRCRQDIFVNCTPLTLGNIKFTSDLKKLLHKYRGIPPKQITFEVTERDSIEGLKNFAFNINVLRLMGFKIAVDDTGAGYSSLNTISEIMPDIIKIDRSVIENIDKNSVKESMLKGLLLVAKEAGSLVVAEGIENQEEASVLTRNNVDLAQGNFYARPAMFFDGIAT
ncbi:EAL domain-containing protein (putative c-di-GMP-specific phosphodiesterase class I) [Neobacillus niacini]|uniref:EAL domain-containing protein n=1 Tax=Neobacillus niacini TaxID=86668 RepID=UPI00285C786F|nr:EAL domain-containing protein [Neobacillus niacini]MDR7079040.1 EAL domain-containing protein (putative c-di-GMP-specific phosphodiesterase class I) [Neobacillus niacini]